MKAPPYSALSTAEEFKAELAKSGGRVLPVRKEFAGIKVKANDDGTIDFVLSTASPDRSNDVIEQSGWDLSNYSKNPVMLWAHDYSQPPVGKPGLVGVDGDNLVGKSVKFTDRDLYEFGWMIGEMYRQGFLSAVSVGFRPKKWNFSEERGSGGVDFHAQELLEFSAVPVPANPEALIAAKAAGIPVGAMVEWAEKILDTQDPEARSGQVVQRALAEKLWAIARPSRSVSVAEHRGDDADQEGEDVLVATLAQLTKCIRKLTKTVESLDRNFVQAAASAETEKQAARRHAEELATRASSTLPNVKAAFLARDRNAELAKAISEETTKQLLAITGRND